MNETTILLSSAPNAKPDFLATVEPLHDNNNDDNDSLLPFEIVLNQYTRDSWAACNKKEDTNNIWNSAWLKSVDGKARLPGFLKYLRDRKKAAFGTFEPSSINDNDGHHDDAVPKKGIFVVPFQQPPVPSGTSAAAADVLYCKFVLDQRKISAFQKKAPPPMKQQQQQQQRQRAPQPNKKTPARSAPPDPPKSSSRKGSGGVLGSLLGRQSRTAHHLSVVPTTKKKENEDKSSNMSSSTGTNSSGAVIAKFRQEVEQKLLDFNNSPTQTNLKYHYSLSEVTKTLPQEQRSSITMETLKFLVYEQVEEIGQDKWIAVKEPTEFLDEHTIAIYKEGAAPPEVLEEMNKGDLPDEIRGQAKALTMERMKQIQKKEDKKDKLNFVQTLGKGENLDGGMLETLNTKKRDRRTIEEIQRDMMASGAAGESTNKRPHIG